MYQQYFGLSEAPFSIAPDPRYLFLSNKHREALAHLIYGVGDQGGFVVLTGEVGTGKTTICRCLLQQVPDKADIAYITNPKQSVNQLLQSMFNDLGVQYTQGTTSKDLIDQLNHYLLDAYARGRNTIVIIDEAQNLTPEVLEQLRLLTNLETNEKKLLQLVLLGQPELNTLLCKPELRQLSQRVTARYHLTPLSRHEATAYINHRLSVAGCRAEVFSSAAIRKIYKHSQGVPRLINLICDRALLGTYASNKDEATPAIVTKAAKEVLNHSAQTRHMQHWKPIVVATCVGIIIFAITYFWKNGFLRKNVLTDVATLELEHLIEQNPPQANKRESDVPLIAQSSIQTASSMTSTAWLQSLRYYDDPASALMALYQLWQLNPDTANVHTCLDSLSNNVELYCRQTINTASQLRAYNSPVVLSYKLDSERYGYLLVNRLKGDAATVKIGAEQLTIPLDELFNPALSHSYLLTRIPANIELPISPGDTGAHIHWLQLQIAKHRKNNSTLKGEKIVDKNISQGKNKMDFLYGHYLDFSRVLSKEKYDTPLQQQIMQMQKQLGMASNAIVDIALLVALNKTTYDTDPMLYPQIQKINTQLTSIQEN